MRCLIICFLLFLSVTNAQKVEESRTIHVFVALCDNVNQGIVPVPRTLGDGQNPKTNLYWGALYGLKTHFKKSKDWTFLKVLKTENTQILERVLFKHKTTNTYLLADAYDGKYIKQTTIDFLNASSGSDEQKLKYENQELCFGGGADLLTYMGHDGLMEFSLDENFEPQNAEKRDAIILACISKNYFKPYLKKTGANTLVWSTGLMSPEAYTLKWAIDGWILGESDAEVCERAAQAYNEYQKCGIRGARNLLVSGF
ncbi:hypothetical protein FEE95_07755 [Maribacter algarum]|uniref:Uncharacterized protein n=1 Tax=Maribacter algarum (ex Zhang et al. 2020) TaxID=2578118 RepID=A0A5S3Q150_9FLAO|nr:hypothetical protein [Maribacter algarum]TMM59317.1 hypothetical protein FEE95_07755 [Maribacter algarum]